jgi:hypothetical protein
MRIVPHLVCVIAAISLATGCANQVTVVRVAGGEKIRIVRVGDDFLDAENERFVITEAGLTTYRKGGKNYVRWQFGFRNKQPTRLRLVTVADVTGSKPVPLLRDESPVIDGIEWSRLSGLVEASPRAIPWLYDPGATLRVFRFDIAEVSGSTSVLYQPTYFTRQAKEGILYLLGPETRPSGE